jgi:hypothetical protein
MLIIAVGISVILFISLFIIAQFVVPDKRTDRFYDYDWSESWSDLDKKARRGAVCQPITTIHRKLGQIGVHIWVVPDSCEQGLPHTRAIDVIAIPKNYPKQRLANTIEHEKIHLYQRLHPDSWRRFYRIKWRCEIYKQPPAGMSNELIEMRRSNPDTADAPWVCFMNVYWPVVVYASKTNLSLSRAQVKWWDQRDKSVNIIPPDEWTTFFGKNIHQYEHPHEISAEFICGPLQRLPDCDDLVEDLPGDAPQALRLLDEAWRYDEMFPQI